MRRPSNTAPVTVSVKQLLLFFILPFSSLTFHQFTRDAGSDPASEITLFLTLTEAHCSWTCLLLVSYTTGQVEKHVPLDTVISIYTAYCEKKALPLCECSYAFFFLPFRLDLLTWSALESFRRTLLSFWMVLSQIPSQAESNLIQPRVVEVKKRNVSMLTTNTFLFGPRKSLLGKWKACRKVCCALWLIKESWVFILLPAF